MFRVVQLQGEHRVNVLRQGFDQGLRLLRNRATRC